VGLSLDYRLGVNRKEAIKSYLNNINAVGYTNMYINFYDRYYRKDFFPTFWSNFAGILNSSVVIPKIVISENYQDDWFRDWLTNNYTKSIIDHKSYVVEWSAIIQHIQSSPYYKDAALMSQKGWANADIADPWLIAIAKSMNYTIVTDEVKNITGVKLLFTDDIKFQNGKTSVSNTIHCLEEKYLKIFKDKANKKIGEMAAFTFNNVLTYIEYQLLRDPEYKDPDLEKARNEVTNISMKNPMDAAKSKAMFFILNPQ